ncbi:MAG: PorV/PorQ family protein [Calditrichaeota bacterium]|jgi:hypothetical protein|nr:PorV/PorQ family protein [Calditrichota bacterium]MBT7617787.1 PorV/PorQ family protein [Calditrichota bacterium]MBT7787520.1 PorV/PorQ family protein [Calditrichota bacterium]
MNRLKRVVILVAFLFPLVVYGQAKVGTAGVQFLKVGVSARAIGMGSFTAVADDASALYFNPSGLVQLTMPEGTFSYIQYPAELKFINIGGVFPLVLSDTPDGVITGSIIGIQITSLFSDDMIETTPGNPYGTGRTFSASDLSAGVTYSQRLTKNFSVGATVKFLNERLADKSAFGWGADVGTFYTTGWRRINIGMVIQNFGPDMDFERSPFPLPISFRFGASMIAWESGPYQLLLAGEFVHPNDNLEEYVFGAELNVMKMISFRLGRKTNAWQRATWEEYQEDREKDPFVEYPLMDEDGVPSLDGVSFGLGLQLPEVGLTMDYAWAGLGTLGPVHRFTLGYKLSGIFH